VRELLDRALAGDVRAVGRQHQRGRGRRKVHDRPALAQPARGLLAGEERPLHIDREEVVELLLADFDYRFVEDDAGIVDQDVSLAVVPLGLVEELNDACDRADVRADGFRLAAPVLDLANDLLGGVGARA